MNAQLIFARMKPGSRLAFAYAIWHVAFQYQESFAGDTVDSDPARQYWSLPNGWIEGHEDSREVLLGDECKRY
jgi:hypothetical protein